MISKQQQKYVQSLHIKKYRNEFKRFLVEGEKAIIELLKSEFEVEMVFCTENLSLELQKIDSKINYIICTENQLSGLSTFKTNNSGVAVAVQKVFKQSVLQNNEVGIILDNIQDPGNLGTIIRLADWYGIKQIICSTETVDFYNPKVIASTMGSFTRINCIYTDIEILLTESKIITYGAFLEGKNVHSQRFEFPFYLLIGSESHGISKNIESLITHKITIPRIGEAESLNAGVATGILLDNIFRHS